MNKKKIDIFDYEINIMQAMQKVVVRWYKLKVETSSDGGKEYIRASVFMPVDPKLTHQR